MPRFQVRAPAGAATTNRASRSHQHWRAGRTLTLHLQGDVDEAAKRAVLDTGSVWLAYANLRLHRATPDEWSAFEDSQFEFEDPDAAAAVRNPDAMLNIVMEPGARTFACIGTQALEPATAMVIGVLPDAPEFKRVVLQAFGHLLGLQPEHLHPDAGIPWDEEAVYRHADPFETSREEIAQHFFQPLPRELFLGKPYDPKSIMHRPVLPSWTCGGFEIGANHGLSEMDKAFVRQLYPR